MRLLDMVRQACKELKLTAEMPPPETKLIIADPVWAEIDSGEEKKWQNKDFPNVAPVFPQFFIEGHSSVDPLYWAGLWIRDFTSDAKYWRTTASGELPVGTRWILAIGGFFAYGKPGLESMGNFPGLAFAHVGENGQWLDDAQQVNVFIAEQFRGLPDSEVARIGYMSTQHLLNCIPFAFTTLSLMHCKNVTMEEQHAIRAERRRYERKNGIEISSFHVLKIKPRAPAHKSEKLSEMQAVGLNRQHIAHGHFKTFDPPGLFGKWTGTYWWSDMVRGNPQRGKVDKDYLVEPGEE